MITLFHLTYRHQTPYIGEAFRYIITVFCLRLIFSCIFLDSDTIVFGNPEQLDSLLLGVADCIAKAL